jgi:hypothetical protein
MEMQSGSSEDGPPKAKMFSQIRESTDKFPFRVLAEAISSLLALSEILTPNSGTN